jgi:hypothetical protein
MDRNVQTDDIQLIDHFNRRSRKLTSALMSQKSNFNPFGPKVYVYRYRSWSAYQNTKLYKTHYFDEKPDLNEYIDKERKKDKVYMNEIEEISKK